MATRITARKEADRYRVYLSDEATFLTITQLPGRRWRVNAGPQTINTVSSKRRGLVLCSKVLEPDFRFNN